MANKEKIDYLLLDIRELETQIAGMQNAEVYPVSFFSQTFDLTHKILKDLHALEAAQIETLRQQMEAHQAVLQSIPNAVAEPAETGHMLEKNTQEPVEKIQKSEKKEQELPETSLRPEPESETEQSTVPLVSQQPEGTPAGQPTRSLSDVLEKRNLSDFRKAFSLNDRFRFRRELFDGDEIRMIQAINDLNELHTYEESIAYLNDELRWNVEDPAVADFLKLIEKRFK